jgi:hypothetical protein
MTLAGERQGQRRKGEVETNDLDRPEWHLSSLERVTESCPMRRDVPAQHQAQADKAEPSVDEWSGQRMNRTLKEATVRRHH